MTEPKRFKRGKHTYTNWGHNFKEVRVEGKPKPVPAAPTPPTQTMTIDMDPTTAMGVYSNMTMVHRSPTEVVIDFVFRQPGQNRSRVRSRVVLPPKQVKNLAKLLTKASEELDNNGH